jgi:hypothetical protein
MAAAGGTSFEGSSDFGCSEMSSWNFESSDAVLRVSFETSEGGRQEQHRDKRNMDAKGVENRLLPHIIAECTADSIFGIHQIVAFY